MQTNSLSTILLGLIIFRPSILPARNLSDTEIQDLIQTLTANPLNTWIDVGQVTGTLIEESWPTYSYSNAEIESRINEAVKAFKQSPPSYLRATELITGELAALPYNTRYACRASERRVFGIEVRYNQGQFYWQTDVRDFQDLVQMRSQYLIPYRLTAQDEVFFLNNNTPAWQFQQRFDAHTNKQRIVSWNGYEYVTYNRSPATAARPMNINHAQRIPMYSAPDLSPSPLIAGLVPWGYGFFNKRYLLQTKLSATETVEPEGRTTTLVVEDSGLRFTIRLLNMVAPTGKPSWAVASFTLKKSSALAQNTICSSHRWLNGHWVPQVIITERPQVLRGADRTVRETWQLSFSTTPPAQSSLGVTLEPNARITYNADGHSIHYTAASILDTETLLAEKIAFDNLHTQENCATSTLRHAAQLLQAPIPEAELATLIGADGLTTFSDLVGVARKKGLYGQVVQAEIDSLIGLLNHQIILHLPQQNHFVLLADIDDHYVWLVDFTKNNFLYCVEKYTFAQFDWIEGIALLLNTTPIAVQTSTALQPLMGNKLKEYVGSGYLCNVVLQSYVINTCPPYQTCGGYYYEFFDVMGCGPAPSGSCNIETLLSYMYAPCVTKLEKPTDCTPYGIIFRYIAGCE